MYCFRRPGTPQTHPTHMLAGENHTRNWHKHRHKSTAGRPHSQTQMGHNTTARAEHLCACVRVHTPHTQGAASSSTITLPGGAESTAMCANKHEDRDMRVERRLESHCRDHTACCHCTQTTHVSRHVAVRKQAMQGPQPGGQNSALAAEEMQEIKSRTVLWLSTRVAQHRAGLQASKLPVLEVHRGVSTGPGGGVSAGPGVQGQAGPSALP